MLQCAWYVVFHYAVGMLYHFMNTRSEYWMLYRCNRWTVHVACSSQMHIDPIFLELARQVRTSKSDVNSIICYILELVEHPYSETSFPDKHIAPARGARIVAYFSGSQNKPLVATLLCAFSSLHAQK